MKPNACCSFCRDCIIYLKSSHVCFLARGKSVDKRESVPRSTIPSGRSDRAHNENAQEFDSQSVDFRVRVAVKISHQTGWYKETHRESHRSRLFGARRTNSQSVQLFGLTKRGQWKYIYIFFSLYFVINNSKITFGKPTFVLSYTLIEVFFFRFLRFLSFFFNR